MNLRALPIEEKYSLQVKIKECHSDAEIETTYPVMRQLRPHLLPKNYMRLVAIQKKHGQFRLLAAYDDQERCVGAVGFQEQQRLAFGSIIYIADLVTDREHRSMGVGEQLLNAVKQEAIRLKMDALVLESREDRKEAHTFYKRYGFDMNAYGFRLFAPFNEGDGKPIRMIRLKEDTEPLQSRL